MRYYLCFRCYCALLNDELCCAAQDLIPVNPYGSSDRHRWWIERIARKPGRVFASIDAAVGDRVRGFRALLTAAQRAEHWFFIGPLAVVEPPRPRG